ncbi:FtsW/RodA/SpoVE family cell cycle protein [Patescibacteria group bacterium]
MNTPLLFFRRLNWFLIAPALLLVLFGIVMSYSLSTAQDVPDFSIFWKQVIFSFVGIILLFILSAVDYRFYKSWYIAIYSVAVLLLVGVLIFGVTIRGTKGWFNIFGVTVQVVEFVKILMIVAFSAYLVRLKVSLVRFQDVFISGAAMAVLVILTFLQPDLGSGILLLGIFLGMLLLVKTKRFYVIILILLITISSIVGWFFVLQDFQKDRILTFLNPDRDPLGVGYNLQQSIIAIGSGQLFGRGLTLGPQSRLEFLPEAQNDFIFAVIAEAMGFAGVLLLFFLFITMIIQLLRVARRARDDFGILLASGVAIALIVQTVVNISTNLGLLPVAGLPLPLVSAGGSSLLVSLGAIGIVASIDYHQRLGLK